jgi:ABC-type Fe3+/spermidine/putrescine transport system ATPase subunit
MGPSGSGKSTLLHCLAGILVPDEGEVWFAGSRLDCLGEAERSVLRRDRFGFVFQSGQLVPELTAEEKAGPGNCPAARRSAWRWPAAWSPSRTSSSPTSRPAPWTRYRGSRVTAAVVWHPLSAPVSRPGALYPVMPECNVQAFRARTMIMGTFGAYLAISVHDHETARCEDASLKFPPLRYSHLVLTSLGARRPVPRSKDIFDFVFDIIIQNWYFRELNPISHGATATRNSEEMTRARKDPGIPRPRPARYRVPGRRGTLAHPGMASRPARSPTADTTRSAARMS